VREAIERAASVTARAMRVAADFVDDPGAARALLGWPKFSVTSYFMVSRLLKQGLSPRTVVDVGANVGQFAVATAKLFPEVEVHSFEPVPESVEELRKNVARLGNVTVYPCALGEEEGSVRFHVNVHTHSSSLLPLADSHRAAFPEALEERTIEVEVRTMDRVFEGVELRGPVLIKLDVQGYEAWVLRGGEETLRRADYVVMEVSFVKMYEGEDTFMEMARTMEGYGFRFERPVGWLSKPGTGEILQMDALFARED
jgi:FkbM family methyltransferase